MLPGEDLAALSKRVTGNPDNWPQIAKDNGLKSVNDTAGLQSVWVAQFADSEAERDRATSVGRHEHVAPCKRRERRDCSLIGDHWLARVVLGTKSARIHRRDDRKKLLEGHVKIQEATLAEYPSKVFENLVGDHRGQARSG